MADNLEVGLSSVLNLSIDTRVILRINLSVEGKLSNWSMDIIKLIVYSPYTKSPVLPSYLCYKGPYLQDKYILIIPIQRSWNYHG